MSISKLNKCIILTLVVIFHPQMKRERLVREALLQEPVWDRLAEPTNWGEAERDFQGASCTEGEYLSYIHPFARVAYQYLWTICLWSLQTVSHKSWLILWELTQVFNGCCHKCFCFYFLEASPLTNPLVWIYLAFTVQDLSLHLWCEWGSSCPKREQFSEANVKEWHSKTPPGGCQSSAATKNEPSNRNNVWNNCERPKLC